jgi:hypothetical protein
MNAEYVIRVQNTDVYISQQNLQLDPAIHNRFWAGLYADLRTKWFNSRSALKESVGLGYTKM